ncbi:hypothetical protein [Vallitalea guaymasensis]|uniref:hypothetical protein n=1 Tax=Vallitalea guaymasensis TaxID=1185412 RepID=UPI000DE2C31F|nr:hypothetical protein [Vallitalea guaymasensis]
MAFLPIPAKDYFNDFSIAIEDYEIIRNSVSVESYQGIFNDDEFGEHIAFLMGATIEIGDVLVTPTKSYIVKSIDYDSYNGKPELIKAYF